MTTLFYLAMTLSYVSGTQPYCLIDRFDNMQCNYATRYACEQALRLYSQTYDACVFNPANARRFGS